MATKSETEERTRRARLEPTDVQAAKMELLRMGRERGFITEGEIGSALPSSMITPVELETFFFTLEMMDIKVRLKDGTIRVPEGAKSTPKET